jgi:hypothetical protein
MRLKTQKSNVPDNPFFILGAADHEMRAINALLFATHTWRVYAQRRGERVHASDAAHAEPIVVPSWVTAVIEVECRAPLRAPNGRALPPGVVERVVCDHHASGDPGYGAPASEAHRAASLGQVIAWLAESGRLMRLAPREAPYRSASPPPAARPGLEYLAGAWRLFARDEAGELRELAVEPELASGLAYTCAGDHCLAAAYQGECPGIEPARLLEVRLLARMGAPECVEDYDTLRAQVLKTAKVLARAARASESDLVDARAGFALCRRHGPAPVASHSPFGGHTARCPECSRTVRWAQTIPLLREAAAWQGVATAIRHRGGEIIVGAHPEALRPLARAARARGLRVYGDPARGFLGQRYEGARR